MKLGKQQTLQRRLNETGNHSKVLDLNQSAALSCFGLIYCPWRRARSVNNRSPRCMFEWVNAAVLCFLYFGRYGSFTTDKFSARATKMVRRGEW